MSSYSLHSIRRLNALALFNEFTSGHLAGGGDAKGVHKAFAAHLELNAAAWSAHCSSRPIGDKVARQIEAHCGKPSGWLDMEREHLRPDAAEIAFMSLAQAVWRHANSSEKKALKADFRKRVDRKPSAS